MKTHQLSPPTAAARQHVSDALQDALRLGRALDGVGRAVLRGEPVDRAVAAMDVAA
ncbi:MAG: hypothetical protein J2P50_09440 [Hyphomicrobiaceae bacterium]|nr:hypothetical protein [Hyphomicrobiaceae bacterium]